MATKQKTLDDIMAEAAPNKAEPPEVVEVIDPKVLAKPEPRATELEDGKIQLHDASQVAQLAAFVERSGMKIGGANTHADITLALMAGLEAGLTATQTIKNIMVVNGRPTIWGDALVALVYQSGQCQGIDTVLAGGIAGEEMVATATVRRRLKLWDGTASDTVTIRSFSASDAKTAGLWGKAGPWKNYPGRMLSNRARTFAIRDAFADAIGGLAVTDEAQDYAEPGDRQNVTVSDRPSITDQLTEGADDDG